MPNPLLNTIPTYGIPPPQIRESAADALHPTINEHNRPQTPEHLKRFRASNRPVGKSKCNIPNLSIPLSRPFGKKVTKDDSVDSLLKNQCRSKIAETVNSQIESRLYQTAHASSIYTVPEKVKDSSFGIATKLSESAKSVIYPVDREGELGELPSKYGVGVQVNRNYNWGHIKDPNEVRFGIKVKSNGTSRDCLCPSVELNTIQEATKKSSLPLDVDFRDHVFGKKNQVETFDAGDCIRGAFIPHDIPVVSKNSKNSSMLRTNSTNNTSSSKRPTSNRAYGITQKLGNASDARAAIRPSVYAHLGVSEKDFDTLLTYEELKNIFSIANVITNDSEFDTLFHKAIEIHKDDIAMIRLRDDVVREEPLCTVDIMRKTLLNK